MRIFVSIWNQVNESGYNQGMKLKEAQQVYPALKEQIGLCEIWPAKDWLDREQISRDIPGPRWVVWCQKHNCYMESRNIGAARWIASNPEEFCTECQNDRDQGTIWEVQL
jgi:hypothetical protein